MWWLLFVVPFACGGFCLCCLLRWLGKTKAQEVHVAQVVNADGDSKSDCTVGRPDGVVAFVCGAFCVWWLLLVVPFAYMACMCAWRCALPALRPTNTKLHLRLENGTAIFWRSCANWFWFSFPCCIQLSTTSRKFTPLSYPLFNLFCITSALLRRCFVASALLRRCFCVASALPPSCFSGVPSAFLGLRRCFGAVCCNFGATSVQLRLNLGSTMRSAQPKPHGQLL